MMGRAHGAQSHCHCFLLDHCNAGVTDGATFALDKDTGFPAEDVLVLYGCKYYGKPVEVSIATDNWEKCEGKWILREKEEKKETKEVKPWAGRGAFVDTPIGAAMAGGTLRRLVVSVLLPSPVTTYTPPVVISDDKLTVHVQVTLDNIGQLCDASIVDVLNSVYSARGVGGAGAPAGHPRRKCPGHLDRTLTEVLRHGA